MSWGRVSGLIAIGLMLAGCGNSVERWVPNETLLAEIVRTDPETNPARVGKVARQYFEQAVLDTSAGEGLKGKERKARFLEAFEVLRDRYAQSGDLGAGFNVCFPDSYDVPIGRKGERGDLPIDLIMTFGWECQLIQGNGPSVALLRKDPWVAKHLDAKGNLVVRGDLDQMHDDLHGAMFRIDPTNSQQAAYPDAQGNLEKVLKPWQRTSSEWLPLE